MKRATSRLAITIYTTSSTASCLPIFDAFVVHIVVHLCNGGTHPPNGRNTCKKVHLISIIAYKKKCTRACVRAWSALLVEGLDGNGSLHFVHVLFSGDENLHILVVKNTSKCALQVLTASPKVRI